MKFFELVLAMVLANVIVLVLQGRAGELSNGTHAVLAWLNAPAWGAQS